MSDMEIKVYVELFIIVLLRFWVRPQDFHSYLYRNNVLPYIRLKHTEKLQSNGRNLLIPMTTVFVIPRLEFLSSIPGVQHLHSK